MSFHPFLQALSNYHLTHEIISHPTLGTFTVLQDNQGTKVLQKHIPFEQVLSINTALFDQYENLSYDRIIQLKGFTEEKNKQKPGYTVYYEFFSETLKEEIERKALEGSHYSELQILNILQNISSSLSYMQASKIHHGDIKSVNIVKAGDGYKVLNPALFGKTQVLPQVPRPNFPKDYTRIMTPDIRHALHRDVLDPVHEDYKDDVYGMGLIALDLMTLRVEPSIPVQKRLEQANFFYSNTLVRFVRKMLEDVLSLRLDPVSCNAYIEDIHLKHGLVSFRRFNGHARNQSMTPREVNSDLGREESFNRYQEKALNSPNKQRERRTESVAPGSSRREVSFYNLSNPEHPSNSSNYQVKTSESFSELSKPYESAIHTNYKRTYSIKKSMIPYGRFESIRNSVASTDLTMTNRFSSKESFIDGGYSIWETPRVSIALNISNQRNGQDSVQVNSMREVDEKNGENKVLQEIESVRNVTIRLHEVNREKSPNEEMSKNAMINTKENENNENTPYKANIKENSSEVFDFVLNKDTPICSYKISLKEKDSEKTNKNQDTSMNISPKYKYETNSNSSPSNFSDLHSVTLKSTYSIFPEELNKTFYDKYFNENDKENSLSRNNQAFTYVEKEKSNDQSFLQPKQNITTFIPQTFLFHDTSLLPAPINTECSSSSQSQKASFQEKKEEPRYSVPQNYSFINSSRNSLSYNSVNLSNDANPQAKIIKTITEKNSDGSIYEGEVLGYMKQGKGKMSYPDGRYYQGEWKVGKINGQGTLFTREGTVIYEGQWKDGKYHGKGILNSQKSVFKIWNGEDKIWYKEENAWVKYEGNFRDDKWEGFGELLFKSGDKYIGEFKSDYLHGKGRYIMKDGRAFEGRWDKNFLVERELMENL